MPASAAFMEHLAQCSRCRAEIEGLRDTWQDLKAIHPPERAAIMQPNVLSTLEAVRSEVHHTTNWRKVMPYAVASIVIVLALTGVFYKGRTPVQPAQQIASALVTRNAPVPHFRGAVDAPVTLVEYGDYECPPCATFNPILKELLQRYGNKLRLEYRHYPLTQVHPNAMLAAVAAEAAGEQGHYWEMNDLLFDAQELWIHRPDAEQTFIGFADRLGLDHARFVEALHAPASRQRVSRDMEEAKEAQFYGTPTFFLNGKHIEVSRAAVDSFAVFIDAELKGRN
jgi:protein-disulfide isomerase